ncbi:CLUMA_CG018288, isoform A [Clunio marinus]|uniref:CLUMA_CG018288, isoform A n=1 Tax=Clunio marinus TaxID=568069 RepID=A0A1J1IYR1_9DIPT|nr:CLUMA_CG018288, isoform A [Clunio marinus]
MKLFITFIFIFCVCHALPSVENSPLIVGGDDAVEGAAPFMVSVQSVAIVISRQKISNHPPLYIGSDVISFADQVRSLGLIIDCQLTWKNHVDKIYCNAMASIQTLRKSIKITPEKTRKLLINSLVMPQILYCSNIFMGCNRSCWATISLIFNACLRYAFDLKKFESISPYRNKLLECSIENYVQYRACLFLFQLLKNKQPEYLYREINFPRFPRNRALSFPDMRKTKQSDCSFFVYGVRLWNSLSSEIRLLESVTEFRSQCMGHFSDT